MKIHRILAAVVAAFGFLWSGNAYSAVEKISADKALELLQSQNGVLLVDVRTPKEFADKHIRGAMLLPLQEIDSRAQTALPDKERTIIVYCRTGIRSASAAAKLAGMGYANIYDLGGILSWPYETE